MLVPTFAEQFEAARGNTIHYRGRELRTKYVVAVNRGDTLLIEFLRASDRPVQGLGITCENCQVSIAGAVSKHFGLWLDTAPREVLLIVKNAKGNARLEFFNQWRDEKYGTTLYMLNNAAIDVSEEPDGSVTLRCSDGWTEPDFDNLVVRLSHKKSRGEGPVTEAS
jgi:hypothetical protein